MRIERVLILLMGAAFYVFWLVGGWDNNWKRGGAAKTTEEREREREKKT